MTTPSAKPFDFDDKASIKEYLIDVVTQQIELYPPSSAEYRHRIADWVKRALIGTDHGLDEFGQEQIINEVLADLVGYGPIQPLLEDPTLNEIMVVGPNQVYIERDGQLLDTKIKFEDEAHIIRVINRMLHPMGRQVSIDNPTADARLPDGSRVNVVIPPVAVDGPCITIRKFLKGKFAVEDFIRLGSMTAQMAEFLRACVGARMNIIVSGNTSSGKTSLLNILTGFIPGDERVVAIEDAAELQLQQKYSVSLETKPPNSEGHGAVTTRELVRNSLRMRPDRLIVGEVRTGEALDMLMAMNTGHDGSMTTLHANSPRDAIARLETIALMGGVEIPILAVRNQIASAIDLIVHMDRLTDGTRKIVNITEIPGQEGDLVTMVDIFRFEQSGVGPNGEIQGALRPTGLRPNFTPRLEMAGYKLKAEIFWAGEGGRNRR
ncbi:MAG: CpaF family protein [Anaerolineales bacterium]|nr:CpaF family protein [Chloroflexota bacterium]MBL6979764.1 CpaF family protein [Anaerolineales bacterium]